MEASGSSDLYAYAYRKVYALGASNESRTDTRVNEQVLITIGQTGGEFVYINAGKTHILARISTQNITGYAISYTGSAEFKNKRKVLHGGK